MSMPSKVEALKRIQKDFGEEVDTYTTTTNSIPPELAKLSNLTHLNLSDNKLTGPMPLDFSSLTNLTSLNLSGNFLFCSERTVLDNRPDILSFYMDLQEYPPKEYPYKNDEVALRECYKFFFGTETPWDEDFKSKFQEGPYTEYGDTTDAYKCGRVVKLAWPVVKVLHCEDEFISYQGIPHEFLDLPFLTEVLLVENVEDAYDNNDVNYYTYQIDLPEHYPKCRIKFRVK